jgi:hypothetical protein
MRSESENENEKVETDWPSGFGLAAFGYGADARPLTHSLVLLYFLALDLSWGDGVLCGLGWEALLHGPGPLDLQSR